MKLKFGVPCSKIKDRIGDVVIHCVNEEQAFALACGVILAGGNPTVYCQNSGLLRCGDIICSLFHAYEIPLPKLLLSIRHNPHHHKMVGNITYEFLQLINYNRDIIEIVESYGDKDIR